MVTLRIIKDNRYILSKDCEDRRRRVAQGIEKGKANGVHKGRKEDTDRNALI